MSLGRFNSLTDLPFDGPQFPAFGRTAEGQRDPFGTGTTGPADAVNVGLGLHRQVVVNNVGYAIDIDATGSHVGGNQHVDQLATECIQGPLPSGLRLIAVNRRGPEAMSHQLLGQLIGCMLGLGEDQCSHNLLATQNVSQQSLLAGFLDEQDTLFDALDAGDLGSHVHLNRFAEQIFRKLDNFRRHGGRKEQGLTFFGEFTDNSLQVRQEAHIEHPVGLVKNEDFELIEFNMALVHQVEQTSGCGHKNMGTAFQGPHLIHLADATINQCLPEPEVTTVSCEAVANLDGQFARWCQYQHIRAVGSGLAIPLPHAMEDRQGEGGCLSGSRLGRPQNIMPQQG
jgi:hypothetical protein